LQAQLAGLRIRHALGADGLTDLKVRVHMGGGNFKKQLKRANASGARWAVLLGNNEIEANQLTLKDLLSGEQETLAEGAVVQRIVAGTSNNVD
jgi:histidyl-tRNA synthetase